MLRTIIVDDESSGREILQNLLTAFETDVEVLKACNSAASAIEAIETLKPQLVFLDVEMPGGSGFSVLEATKHLQFDVVFTTAHNQYAIKAFRYSAIDYLLKPIVKKELQDVIEKALARNEQQSVLQKANLLLENLQKNNSPMERIAVHTSDAFHVLSLENIVRLEADNNYTRINLENGEKVLVAKTLKDYEEMLSDAGFFRVHQSHLINLRHIKKYIKGEGGTVVMTNGSEIEISRRNKAQFLSVFKDKH